LTAWRATSSGFTNDILCLFVSSQPQEDGLTKLIVPGPLGKIDLGDQYRLNPFAPLHDRGGYTQSPSPRPFFGQINKGTRRTPNRLQTTVELCQSSLREAGTDSAGVKKPASRAIATDKQCAEIFAAAIGQRVAAYNKLLLMSQLDFDPRPTAPAALVTRIRPFGDQPLEAELTRHSQNLVSGTPQLLGKPDIVRSFL
jgi:hypothetical protein